MNGKAKDLDQLLDQALDGIRESRFDPATEAATADRVWSQVDQEIQRATRETEGRLEIRDCTDFQALIPAYLRDGLTDAKAMLLEDHVSECLPCRKALKRERSARRSSRSSGEPARESNWAVTAAWRVAAAAVIFLGIFGLSVKTDLFTIQTGGLITIEAAEGEVMQVTDEGTLPVLQGQRIDFEDVNGVRTGNGSSALLRLDDGSLVEMNERAELAFNRQRKPWQRGNGDGVIDLSRGNVIVEASDQGSGHLFVDTNDCQVAVTGTVFAVNNGIKGSRVSVIEGEVQVAFAGHTDVLHPGEQTTTSASLAHVPVEEEIAWSRNLEQHLELLHEFARVAQEIDAALEQPGLRYSTELLDLAPDDTAVYVAIPNISATVADAYDLLQQKISENDLLSQWWDQSMAGTETDSGLQRAMDKIRAYGEQIGEEVTVTLQLGADGQPEHPLILARLINPDTFGEMLQQEIAELGEMSDEVPGICIFNENSAACGEDDELFIWIHEGFLAISPEMNGIDAFALNVQRGGRSEFTSTGFHQRLAALYGDGVQWLIGADLQALIGAGMSQASNPDEQASLERMGLLDLEYAIVEHKEVDGRSQNRAVLTFVQARRGIAAWLAEPAPMGSLDFISPDAYFASGFVMKEPASVIDELFAYIGAENSNFESSLQQFEDEYDIDLREDIVAALGGEFAFALDGPVLPKPSWKLVMEVYDPDRLQTALGQAIQQVNDLMQAEDKQGFATREETAGGRIFHEIESLDTGISAHYVFVDGYMVASASRALLERSLQGREAGTTLTRSAGFQALLPPDGQINFSGVVYQNLGPLLGPLARMGEGAAANISPRAEELIQSLGSMNEPSLALIYGEPNLISFVNMSEGGMLTSSLGRFLSLPSMLNVQELVEEAIEEESRSNPELVNEG